MSYSGGEKVFFRPKEFFIGNTDREDVCISDMQGTICVKGDELYVRGTTRDGHTQEESGTYSAMPYKSVAVPALENNLPGISGIAKKDDPAIVPGIFLNGEPVRAGVCRITVGDFLQITNTFVVFLANKIRISGNIAHFQSTLRQEKTERGAFENFPHYKRSPRLIRTVRKQEIRVERPKSLGDAKPPSLISLILPPLVMIIVTVGIRVLVQMTSNSNVMGPFIFLSIAGTGVSLVTSIMRYFSSRKDRKEEVEKREKSYEEYLLRKRKEIFKAYRKEKDAYTYNYPTNEQISKMVRNYSPRVYERSSNDDDFLHVVLGMTSAKPQLKITFSTDELKNKEDPLEEEAKSLRDEFTLVEKPLVVDLKKAHLGLVGEKELIHEQLKSLVLQMTFFHSYHDLEIIAIFEEKYNDEFMWMRWYPHFRIHAINCTGFVNSERKRDQIFGSLHQILKERKTKEEESKKDSMYLPHIVFIIDEPKWVIDHSIMEFLGKDGYNIGFSIIYTTYLRANLPENIGTVAEIRDSEEGMLLMEEKTERMQWFSLPTVEGIDLEWTARDLGVLEHVQGTSAQIPKSITFFKMYGITRPEELDIGRRWRKSDSAKSLAVPLGVRAVDDYVNLNLHEKAHGPHGLIAGTTGSGKSELVQSYILSLAVNFHPYEVAFLLIDYKGGGMANLFRDLPHLLGTITNLDGAQSTRAMASIKSELARRQAIFNLYNVNHINDYSKKFRGGEAQEPLPHLFIISDEFAELKKEKPDFMKELVSTARVGRSLGVHLILATQKPTGVVDDQIWSNSRFKIALKVQNESDSREILKTSDAANITNPGRAYLQVGNNEIYELFQSAWSGAPYSDEEGREKVDDRVYVVNQLGQGELVNQDLSEEVGESGVAKTQLSAIVDYIHAYYEGIDTVEVKKPWLPPLPEQIVSPWGLRTANGASLNLAVPLGLIDIPERQAQEEYVHDFAEDGNLLYVASPGYGKTVFLTTVALTMAMRNSVANLNFYVLDFGNSGLIPLRKLHHVADYVTVDDGERLNKLVGILQREVALRKRLLAEAAVQSITVYNQVATRKMKAIVILVDNFDAVRELGYDMEDFFQRMTRDGAGLGIYFVACITRSNAMKYGTYNNFKNKICGFLFEESDVSMVVGRSEYKPSEIRGRALVKYMKAVSVMQIYSMADTEDGAKYNREIAKLIQSINALYPDQVAPKIPVLPETLLSNMLGQFAGPKKDVYVGLDKETVELCGFNRGDSPFVIVGEAKRGKTNALRLILGQIIGNGKIYLFDSKAMDLFSYKGKEGIDYVEAARQAAFYDELKVLVGERKIALQKGLADNPSANPKSIVAGMDPVYLISDDWDDFVEGTKAKQSVLAPLLEEAVTVGVCIIITVNAGKLKGFDAVSKFAKNTTNGMMVSGQGMTNIFPLTSMRDAPEMKDALLFHNGAYVRVRVPEAVWNE